MFNDHNGLVFTRVDVAIWRPRRGDDLRAVVDCELNGCFAVHDVRIVEHPNGRLMVVMPSRQRRDGVHVDVAHPLDNRTRLWMESAILPAYVAAARREAAGLATFEEADDEPFWAPPSSCGHPTEEVLLASRGDEFKAA